MIASNKKILATILNKGFDYKHYCIIGLGPLIILKHITKTTIINLI